MTPTAPADSGSRDHTSDERHRVLELRRVSKCFRSGKKTTVALDDVSLQAFAGRITSLAGPDGAGKTTLLRLAAGLLGADRGEVIVLGHRLSGRMHAGQSAVGYMPQNFGLYEDLTVQENLDLFADLRGQPPAQRAERYRELMDMTGLEPFTDRLAGQLSGGMKQKLRLACVLVRSPRLLLLDEPTAGVDPRSRRELWEIIDRLARENTAVLLTTGYLDEVEWCHNVYVMEDGRLLEQGKPDGCLSAASRAVADLRLRGNVRSRTCAVRCIRPRSQSGFETAAGELIVLVAVLWFEVPFVGSLIALYVGLTLFLLSAVGVGLMISSLAASQQQALLGAFFFLVPAVILSGFATPIANMPRVVQWITLLNPLRYFLVILRGVFLQGTPLGELGHQLWPMGLIGLASLTLAGWLFRRRVY